MSTGYNVNGIDLSFYLQPYFSGSQTPTTVNYNINGTSIALTFARRDNDPNNAPTITTGYKINGVDIATLFNKFGPTLTAQLSGSTTYNGQGQQASVIPINPSDSWITVGTSTKTNAGTYSNTAYTYNSNGYTLTIVPSSFTINPSTISIISSGTSSFTWTGSPINFTNYTVTGVFAQDNGWSVSGTTQTGSGSYNATLSTTSGNYTLGTSTLAWTINAIAPSTPTIGSSSSGDKSFTANWTASASTGGATVTYYVSYSTNGGSSWSSEVTTTSTSYTWSGNQVIFNGNNYIARVRATNSSTLFSGYSSNSVPVTPTFTAPTVQSINFATPSLANPNVRPFTITLTPTSCVDYSITRIYVQNETFESPFILGYYDSVNSGYNNLYTQTTGQQTTGTISNVYAQTFASGSGFFTNGNAVVFKVYAITYNNDGYGVASSIISNTSPAQQSTYVYNPTTVTFANAINLYSTGTFNVSSNTYSQVSTAYPSNDQNIVKLTVNARTTTLASSINITSTGRTFTVGFSGTTPASFAQTLSGSQAPWNNLNASFPRSLDWDVIDTGFNNSAGGRIRVVGGGTIGTPAPGQVIQVTVQALGQTRTLTYY